MSKVFHHRQTGNIAHIEKAFISLLVMQIHISELLVNSKNLVTNSRKFLDRLTQSVTSFQKENVEAIRWLQRDHPEWAAKIQLDSKKTAKCILLIDDDQLLNLTHTLLIEEIGGADYIIAKKSAIDGLDYLSQSVNFKNGAPFPNLIFVDINMPGQTGWDFLDLLQHVLSKLPKIPVIYLFSSLIQEEYALRLDKYPSVKGIQEKPLTREKLNSILQRHFLV